MIKETTSKLIDQKDLTYDETRVIMDEIMSDSTSPVQTAAFLATFFAKGRTIERITVCTTGMHARALLVGYADDPLEIAGTGRDGSNSFNISTIFSIVIAAGGVRVVKHGNRAASPCSSAADCLGMLGVDISPSPEQHVSLPQSVGICFLSTQTYHFSMEYIGPVRKELGIRTILNVLGPLINPTHANLQVLGVYSEEMVEPLAHMLYNLDVRRGMMVCGQDKLDEISLSSPTTICEFNGDEFITYVIHPWDFDLTPCGRSELVGGTSQENTRITLGILNGAKGVKRDVISLSAGAGLYIVGKVASLEAGVRLTAELVDSGRAMTELQKFTLESNREEEAAS